MIALRYNPFSKKNEQEMEESDKKHNIVGN